jgi:hypothetical protein
VTVASVSPFARAIVSGRIIVSFVLAGMEKIKSGAVVPTVTEPEAKSYSFTKDTAAFSVLSAMIAYKAPELPLTPLFVPLLLVFL